MMLSLRTSLMSRLLGGALLTLPLVACETEPPAESPTPEASPTPIPATPTAVPNLAGEYKTTSFLIAPPGTGFDLDGNGTLDNNLPSVFDTLNTQLYSSIYDAILEANGGNTTQAQALTDQIWTALEEAGLVLDVDTLNTNLTAAINSDALIYLETLTGPPDEAVLTWFNGLKNGAGAYVTDISVGTQTGSVDLDAGKGTFGPGSFTYVLGGSLSLEVTGTLASCDYTITGNSTALTAGLLGGAILQSEVEALLRNAIPDSNQIPEDEIVTAALEAITPFMDLTINGEAAFSVAFNFSTASIDIGDK